MEYRCYRGSGRPVFAHQSEREFAEILDRAGIAWEYEPKTFVLEERDGRVLEGFTPDFYLPDADVYVECTTMKRSLANRKNRKVRKLREQGVIVTLHHRADMERLVELYGPPAATRAAAS